MPNQTNPGYCPACTTPQSRLEREGLIIDCLATAGGACFSEYRNRCLAMLMLAEKEIIVGTLADLNANLRLLKTS